MRLYMSALRLGAQERGINGHRRLETENAEAETFTPVCVEVLDDRPLTSMRMDKQNSYNW